MPKSKVTTDKLCFLINSFSLTYVEALQELRSCALEGIPVEAPHQGGGGSRSWGKFSRIDLQGIGKGKENLF